MKANLDSAGRLIPPASISAARTRLEQLEREVATIDTKINDTGRRAIYVTSVAYDEWRWRAVRARQYLERELLLLRAWLAAHPDDQKVKRVRQLYADSAALLARSH
jgi:hypothetical protein